VQECHAARSCRDVPGGRNDQGKEVTGKPDEVESPHVRFGGGPTEKGSQDYLAGGLPNDNGAWRVERPSPAKHHDQRALRATKGLCLGRLQDRVFKQRKRRVCKALTYREFKGR